jgi:hypothetical protein
VHAHYACRLLFLAVSLFFLTPLDIRWPLLLILNPVFTSKNHESPTGRKVLWPLSMEIRLPFHNVLEVEQLSVLSSLPQFPIFAHSLVCELGVPRLLIIVITIVRETRNARLSIQEPNSVIMAGSPLTRHVVFELGVAVAVFRLRLISAI